MIHFIWFGPRALGYPEYLAVKTAAKVYNTTPNLWTDSVPKNEWLERVGEFTVQHQVKDKWLTVTDILEVVHKTDYLRYQLLYEYGGLYLDFDTLCVKSVFDLNLKGLVIGYEPSPESKPDRVNGAVMFVDHPQYPAVAELLNKAFIVIEETWGVLKWNQLGPQVLSEVVRGREDCTVLPREYLHFYSYVDRQKIFEDNPIDDRMYAIHYWGKQSMDFVRETVTPEYIQTSDSLYAKVVRKVLGDAASGG